MAEEEEVQVPEEQTEETDERWFVAPKTLVEMPTKPASDAVTFDAQNDDDTELFLFSFPQNVCSSIHIPPAPLPTRMTIHMLFRMPPTPV